MQEREQQSDRNKETEEEEQRERERERATWVISRQAAGRRLPTFNSKQSSQPTSKQVDSNERTSAPTSKRGRASKTPAKMIKLFKLKEKAAEEASKEGDSTSAAHIRAQKGMHVEDWKPVLSLQSVIDGLSILLLEPNPSDPLNKDAARAMKQDLNDFERTVRRTLKGGSVDGIKFDKCL
ncbi:hypothetical protein PTSG_09370 [Salpingoeca rosetta]|uniref:UBC core domain-containing protein n=1 Tax=Salpingoeca rosetta (strain ATCC 50818 / BSB-021) TaxID=946362 RepID=F2UMF4_SALR5|nr:uncharacterized protein PTSG_09370 [Salpingoeca rosetta]EGD78303.1 hypothetical protein PTSG_09370 [Salpingoeca rosetta]|eukprot:XP_004989626.1 hypothetical protein PTSG_09370 [Salpingoeca rosetta]